MKIMNRMTANYWVRVREHEQPSFGLTNLNFSVNVNL